MTGAHPSKAWYPKEDDTLTAMWNAGDSFGEMIAALPRHATKDAIKMRVFRLREMGHNLPTRRKAAMSAEERKRQQIAAKQAWLERQRTIPDFAPAGTTLFTDHPNADRDAGFVTKIIPSVSLASSPLVSTAAMAVRG